MLKIEPSSTGMLVTHVTPPTGWVRLNLREIWRYRDLLLLLTWRDFSAKYRQSLLGITWAFASPVATMLVFSIVFGKMANFPSDDVPYPVFNFAGLLPWLYFSTSLSSASASVVGSRAILTKVYFPRLVLPLSKTLGGLIDFGIRGLLLAVLLAWYGIMPGWQILLLPVFIAICAISALSVALWTTALTVKYRDVQQIVGFLSRMWIWVTPVTYSISMVPAEWRGLYSLNPMVGAVEGFRWAILGKAPPDWTMMAISLSATAALFIGGLYFFRRTEETFADLI